MTRRPLVTLAVALVLGNGLAALAGIATNRILDPSELGPEVMRSLGATALTFTIVVAIVVLAFDRTWRAGAIARVMGGALAGAVLAGIMLVAGGLRATGPLFWVVLAIAEALVVAGAWLARPR